MSQLFYAIVALFRVVCRLTGLSYAELNILVYCALVPTGWLLIVVWRRKSLWPWLLGQVGVVLALLTLRRGHLGPSSQRFYDYNIAVLEKLGHATGGGYLAVSLLMGVFIPAVSVVLLLSVPRRALVGMYLFFIGALVTYFWLGQGVIVPPDASKKALIGNFGSCWATPHDDTQSSSPKDKPSRSRTINHNRLFMTSRACLTRNKLGCLTILIECRV